MNNHHHWKSIVVAPDLVLSEAIPQMDKQGKRTLLVTDSNYKLLGVVSDGDLRRALLRGISLRDRVCDIMQCSPIVASINWSKTRLLSRMEQDQLLLLPVVDETNTLIDVAFLYELLQRPKLDNPVCLMAGGFGTRLKPLTDTCPKPMLKLGNKPILEMIMERFIKAGFHNFYVSTHYRAEQIREYFGDGSRWGVSIEYLHESEPLGTAGALGLLPKNNALGLPMFLMNGDLLTDIDFLALLSHHEETKGVATVCVREYEHQVPFGVMQTRGDKIIGIEEKPVIRHFVNAGIYLLEPELIACVTRGQRMDMPDLLNNAMNNGQLVTHFKVEQDWLDIGRLDDFHKAQNMVNEFFNS